MISLASAARIELSLIRGVFDDHLVIGGTRLDWREIQASNTRGRLRQCLYESHALKNDIDRRRPSDWLIAVDDPRRLALAGYVEGMKTHFEVVSARLLAKAARLDPVLFGEGISISLDFAFEISGDRSMATQEPHCLTLAAGAGLNDFSYSWYCLIGRRAGKIGQSDNPAFNAAAFDLNAALVDEIEPFLDTLDEDFQTLAESFEP